jgi:oligopeptide transport system permease protein
MSKDKNKNNSNKKQEEIQGISLWKDAWNRLKKNTMAMIGGVVIIFFILVAILADVISPYSYEKTDLPSQYLPPSFDILISPGKAIEEFALEGLIDKNLITQSIEDIKLLERERIKVTENKDYATLYSLKMLNYLTDETRAEELLDNFTTDPASLIAMLSINNLLIDDEDINFIIKQIQDIEIINTLIKHGYVKENQRAECLEVLNYIDYENDIYFAVDELYYSEILDETTADEAYADEALEEVERFDHSSTIDTLIDLGHLNESDKNKAQSYISILKERSPQTILEVFNNIGLLTEYDEGLAKKLKDFEISQNDKPTRVLNLESVNALIDLGYLDEEDRARATEIVEKLIEDQPFPHVFGTDSLGRDLFSRVIYGSRISLSIGIVTAFVALFIGVTFGAIAGFAGGRVDNLMMRFVDILYGLPFMFFVILLMVIFGREFYMVFIGIGAVSWMTLARITRGQIISLKNNEYIEAARSIGASNARLIFRHLVPNALGPIIVYVTLTIPSVMLWEAFLSFLGLGVQAPMTSWGLLANEGSKGIISYPWLILFPGIALALVLFFLNFLGEGLRDALDPSMKNKL